jgi:hypothetical protein
MRSVPTSCIAHERDWEMKSKATLQVGYATALTLAVALTPLACGSTAPERHAARHPTTPEHSVGHSVSIDTGFEDGTSGPITGREHVRVTRTAAKHGSFGLDVHSTGAGAYAIWDPDPADPTRSWWSFRAWVRVTSWTALEAVDIVTVRNLQEKNNFDLFVDAPQRNFRWDLYRGDTASGLVPVGLHHWYRIEASGTFAAGTYHADVNIDGVRQPSITSTGQVPSAVKDVVFGPGGAPKTNEVQYDDVRVVVADHPLDRSDATASRP